MPSRGRHRTTSKECQDVLRRIEGIVGVTAVIIGRSYGGKSLGNECRTGSIRIQRQVAGGLKAVMQSSKGLQEIISEPKPVPRTPSNKRSTTKDSPSNPPKITRDTNRINSA